MSRGFRQGRSYPVPRRRKGWEAGPGQLGVQTQITATTAILVNGGIQILADGLTLLRLRGTMSAFLSAGFSLGGFSGAFAVGIIDLQAFNAGVASTPTPIDEVDWDGWLYWEAFDLKQPTSTFDSAAPNSSLRMPVDTKAMRKVKQDDVVFAAIQVVEVGTATLNWHFDSRMLFALA